MGVVVELYIEASKNFGRASRCSEIGCLQAKLARCSISRSAAWTCLRIQHVAHGREIARAALLLDRMPQCSSGAPAAEASETYKCTSAWNATPSRARGLHAENAPNSAVLTRPPPQV